MKIKKMLFGLAAMGCAMVAPLAAQATPEQDLKEFQDYFKKKFPDVSFDEFSNGIYALPVAKDRREEWESIMEFPPFELELEQGKTLWETPMKSGKTMASCFKNGGVNIVQGYPYWDEATRQVRTLEMDINACRKRNGEAEFTDLNKGPLATVAAYMKSLSKGQRIKLDLSSAGAQEAFEKGKNFYWGRRGQLNFACAHCHVGNAGKFIRGNILSTGLGHGAGFPTYRADWGYIGTLHHRYAGCNNQVRAKPLKPQSEEYRALELYETYMNTGLPLTAPSHRP